MTNIQFDIFLEKAIKNYGEDYIEFSEETIIQHTFSKRFERKTARLIRQQKSFYFPMIRTPIRRTVTIMITVIIILSTTVISVSALREAFVHFITEIFDTHTKVQTIQDDTSPESFEDIYALTNIPDGFEIVFQNDNITEAPALITEYRNGQHYMVFTQYLKSAYNPNVNTQGHEMVCIDINEKEGFMIDMGDGVYIAWDNGDYIFEIVGNIGESALINMAKSVQKAE